jgi:hypothetical protein
MRERFPPESQQLSVMITLEDFIPKYASFRVSWQNKKAGHFSASVFGDHPGVFIAFGNQRRVARIHRRVLVFETDLI